MLLLLCLALSASAAHRTLRQFVHKSWTERDGAPARIFSIRQSRDGYLWLASNQGLYRFDGVKFEHYQPDSGPPLPPQGASALLVAANGDLWVGHRDAGVSLIRNGINLNYSTSDNLPAGTGRSLVQDRQGAIWVGTARGLYRFTKGPVVPVPIPGTSGPSTIANNDGAWNEAGSIVNFHIEPTAYQTLWFQTLCGSAALALLWFIYRLQLRQATAQLHGRLEGQMAERERIARELHDTLLQSFQGLMLRLQVVEDMLPPGEAREQLEAGLERADLAIIEGRSAVQNLRCGLSCRDLILALRAHAADLLGDAGPAFRLNEEGAPRDLHPVLRDELFRIAGEALRNAFRHAQAEHIEIDITYGGRTLCVRIRDDGTGIDLHILDAGRSGHFGLRGMRERAQQLGGNLKIFSRAGAGTEIEITVPAAFAYLKPQPVVTFWPFRGKDHSTS
ncbi:sensor histidine kinase [Paludibaculum fermentans]|uniref:sensor histidine kinase n=1 Tax=Paludibaculum fermentans TaxID=1473598 RepID=UPI003EBF2984